MNRNRKSRVVSALLAAGIGIALPVRGQEMQSCVDSSGQLRIIGAEESCRAGETLLAAAQTGVIAFKDGCTGRLYAMRADGTGRIALPLPPLPLPTDRYWVLSVLDVTTSGPITVLYRFIISRTVVINGQNVLTWVDYGLVGVGLRDVAGVLTPDPLVRLGLPEIDGLDPNLSSFWGSFSPAEPGGRLALVVSGGADTKLLMTAQVERDATLKIIGLSNLVEVGELHSIGVLGGGVPDPTGFSGGPIDYSPDGNSIVASIFEDLWRIHLGTDNTYLSVEWLTPNTDGFVETNPAVSPDGSRIAYTHFPVGSDIREDNIHSLSVASGEVTQVTQKRNKGNSARARDNAMWSSDGAWIGFTALTSKTTRNTKCGAALVNSEIFLIRADGSTTATQITNTNGTSVENYSEWGW